MKRGAHLPTILIPPLLLFLIPSLSFLPKHGVSIDLGEVGGLSPPDPPLMVGGKREARKTKYSEHNKHIRGA